MEDITESFEANMLAMMGQEAENDLQSVSEATKNPALKRSSKSPAHHGQNDARQTDTRHMYDFSPTLTHSDDDTSLSTWQAPVSPSVISTHTSIHKPTVCIT